MPERDIVARAAAGDEQAFRRLYLAHRDSVFRFGFWLSGSHEIAEDMMQECFLALLERPRAFDPTRVPLRVYLLGIVRNQCAKRLRHTREGEPDVETPVPGTQLDDVLAGESAEAVREAVSDLPPLQREAIALAHFEGLAPREIAEVLGIDIEAVKGRLKRGREALRARLAPLAREYR